MRNFKNISLVIFDMDGLMFDTERIAVKTWLMAGKDFGYCIPESAVLDIIGVNAKFGEDIIKKNLGQDFPYEKVRNRNGEYAMEFIRKNGVPVKKGLHELLDFIEEQHILKAVATSTERKRASEILSMAGVKDRFDLIVYGDEIEKSKPEPDIFLAAAGRLNISPERCIVLEDSQNGIIAASKAGMFPILVPDLKELPGEFERLAYKKFSSLLEFKEFLKMNPDTFSNAKDQTKSA